MDIEKWRFGGTPQNLEASINTLRETAAISGLHLIASAKTDGRVVITFQSPNPFVSGQAIVQSTNAGTIITVVPSSKNKEQKVNQNWLLIVDALRNQKWELDPESGANELRKPITGDNSQNVNTLFDGEYMKRHYKDYSALTAKDIIEAFPRAWETHISEERRWGPGCFKGFVHINSTTVHRYLKAFWEAGIEQIDGINVPYRPRKAA